MTDVIHCVRRDGTYFHVEYSEEAWTRARNSTDVWAYWIETAGECSGMLKR
jgi:hypothetical protein